MRKVYTCFWEDAAPFEVFKGDDDGVDFQAPQADP